MKALLVLNFLAFLSPVVLLGQNELTGTIKETKSGSPLQGIFVYIPDLKTGAVTDVNGSYVIHNIPPGVFLVEAGGVGYTRQIDHLSVKGKTQKDYILSVSHAELQEILVTGVSAATERRKNPVPSAVVTQKDLQQSVATNVIDAIQSVPGVSEITEGPAISKPVIRGLGYNRVLVMNDGVRQEGQQWGDEFGIEIDEYAVNRVEVLKGPSSVAYGSDAMAGVINFLGPDPLPEGKINGSVLGNYQTNNGLYATSLDMAGNQKGFIWDLRYTHKAAHAYQNKYDGYVRNSGYGENDAKAILGLNRKWGYSHLTLGLFDLKLGIVEGARDSATGAFTQHFLDSNGGDSLGIAPGSGYTRYNYYPIIHQHVRHYKAVLDNSIALGQGRLALKLGIQENYRQEANDITKGDIYNNYFFLRTVNYDAQYIAPEKNGLSWSFGVNGMGQASQDRGIVFLVPEYNSFDIGVFGSARKSIGKLTLSGGLRWDSRTLHGKDLYIDSSTARLSGPEPGAIRRFTAYNSDFSGVSGSIGATYDLSKSLYAKLNLSRGFRAPNIAESGSDGIHDGTPFYEIGDAHLKAESSFQTDLTVGVNTEEFSAEINGFVNKINNYIFPVKLASVFGGDSMRTDFAAGMTGPTFKYVSGDAVLSGGELAFTIHPSALKWLSIENSFSFLSAIQQHQGDSTKYLPYSPPQKLLSYLRLSCKKIGSALTNAFFRVGIDDYFNQDKFYYKFGDETKTPGYVLLNAGIGADISNGRKTLFTVYLSGNNLTDKAYQSNMSRLKYTDVNNVTGRTGVYNMGRNFSFKLIIPFPLRS